MEIGNKVENQQEDIYDLWEGKQVIDMKDDKRNIPAVIIPHSGISYNPTIHSYYALANQIVQQQKPKSRKIKKQKKIIRKVIHKPKNIKQREQVRKAIERKKERIEEDGWKQIHKYWKKVQKQDKTKQDKIQKKKMEQLRKQQQERQGKVRLGKKLGKVQYKLKTQDILKQEELPSSLRKIPNKNFLLRQRQDSVFRRGILQMRKGGKRKSGRKKIKVRQGNL